MRTCAFAATAAESDSSSDAAPVSLPDVATAGAGERDSRDLPHAAVARYLADLDSVPWRWLGPGVRYCQLPLSAGAKGDLRLLKIAPGRRMPEHGHGGTEMTLVLRGAYSDETGAFRSGDMQDVDGELEHQPVVDPVEGCICLVAAENPARFKGVISRLLQPWSGM